MEINYNGKCPVLLQKALAFRSVRPSSRILTDEMQRLWLRTASSTFPSKFCRAISSELRMRGEITEHANLDVETRKLEKAKMEKRSLLELDLLLIFCLHRSLSRFATSETDKVWRRNNSLTFLPGLLAWASESSRWGRKWGEKAVRKEKERSCRFAQYSSPRRLRPDKCFQ